MKQAQGGNSNPTKWQFSHFRLYEHLDLWHYKS